jgi:hypothetical protein
MISAVNWADMKVENLEFLTVYTLEFCWVGEKV